jgi:uncharacterized membrane protein (UPF0127 family)
MPRVSLKKIKSALNKRPVIAVAGVVAAALIVGGVITFAGRLNAAPYTLELNNRTYHLESATTTAEREKGLGGRRSMADDHGMVFVFGTDSRQCFWMKDTHFALDMIWVSSAKKIAAIEKNVVPGTYPTVFCHTGRYVIELNAGVAASNKISVGQELNF